VRKERGPASTSHREQLPAGSRTRVRERPCVARERAGASDEGPRLRVVEQRYRVGAATILDLLNSQEALTQAEVDAVAARFDYLRAKAQIEALIGRDL